MEMEKTYNPKKFEDDIYNKELISGYFSPDKLASWIKTTKKDPDYFSMVLPPPNVTGVLHMGHAAMLAIEDLLARYNRMLGKRTLWLPGTDHAAIATQTKVEKLLIEQGIKNPKEELGRDKFLEKVDEFAKKSHDTIINQCKKMGSSLDWEREAFTLDEKRSLTVRTVFKKMYDDGLIERGYRIVNWCPRCHSTLADDEVEYEQQNAIIYTFKYSKDFPFAISTTRPETKLGDTAVAVHPEDDRYTQYIGQTFKIKSFANGADLNIKIIGNYSVDKEFGTGAVGVTPAHSLVDYEMGLENNLPVIKIINEDGFLTKEAGENFKGLSVLEARNKVVQFLREQDLMLGEENLINNLSVCYRCNTAIEPLPSKQWFIKVNKEFKIKKSKINGIKDGDITTLKKLMKAAVTEGQIKIIPDHFEKIYFHWIDNLRDWCISRQIWYGHQIPVWYKKNNSAQEEIYVDLTPPKDAKNWTQDPDTLDTWFSSGLWTFSTLGWPEQTDDLLKYHPTSVMETGYDILPFWVARMILMTTYVLGDIPFKKVYLHGLVRDEQGRKMSKSLGNVINPLDMIDQYGADATRLSLLIGCSPGNDLKLSEEKIASFRNFTNKLWNISRFILLNIEDSAETEIKINSLADKWILTKLNQTIEIVTKNIEQFNFSFAGEYLRDFTWNELADWYLEIAKVEGNKSSILKHILENILRLWHPFMPFATEAIWQFLKKDNLLLIEQWPKIKLEYNFSEIKNFEIIKSIIVAIRGLRTDYKIESTRKIKVFIKISEKINFVKENEEIIKNLAKISELKVSDQIENNSELISTITQGVEIFLDLSSSINKSQEIERLQKEKEIIEPYLNSLIKKLSNEEFIKNAPAQIVELEKNKMKEAQLKLEKILEQIKKLI